MAMTERVARLRAESLAATPTLSAERAMLMTAFYRQERGLTSAPMCRALAFQHLMEHKTIYIGDGELIVGEKGPAPKAAPTYPELCCHTLEDLDILNSREKIAFAVSPETRQLYEQEIIPCWRGRTMRELIFAEMTDEWKAAYEAGIFTEFMEQRSPGHTVLDDKIYRKGMLDFKADIERALAELDDLNDPTAYARQEQLKAMAICADALIRFARRHAEKARELAQEEHDPQRRQETDYFPLARRGSVTPARGGPPAHRASGSRAGGALYPFSTDTRRLLHLTELNADAILQPVRICPGSVRCLLFLLRQDHRTEDMCAAFCSLSAAIPRWPTCMS